jgi:hypothetical protein
MQQQGQQQQQQQQQQPPVFQHRLRTQSVCLVCSAAGAMALPKQGWAHSTGAAVSVALSRTVKLALLLPGAVSNAPKQCTTLVPAYTRHTAFTGSRVTSSQAGSVLKMLSQHRTDLCSGATVLLLYCHFCTNRCHAAFTLTDEAHSGGAHVAVPFGSSSTTLTLTNPVHMQTHSLTHSPDEQQCGCRLPQPPHECVEAEAVLPAAEQQPPLQTVRRGQTLDTAAAAAAAAQWRQQDDTDPHGCSKHTCTLMIGCRHAPLHGGDQCRKDSRIATATTTSLPPLLPPSLDPTQMHPKTSTVALSR